jgi:hypothetical protein
MGGDLALAQDYENYLNNREAINAVMAANPESAFTAGWIATFARVNELGLNHTNASDFTGGLVGFLDSVNKAGLGADASNVSVKHGTDGLSIVVDVRVANGVEVPGALLAFADLTSEFSDAIGTTVQFVFNNNIAVGGFHPLGSTQAANGDNDLWIGVFGAANTFQGTGGHDILVGGAWNDVITGGAGWDFIDGGPGDDILQGQDGNDILRGGPGNDNLQGGPGNDTYVFARGDGGDVVVDEGGADSLLFGTGISHADVLVQSSGNDVIIAVRDPAHPNTPFEQLTDRIRLQGGMLSLNGIENFRFADGATLDLAGLSNRAPVVTATLANERLNPGEVLQIAHMFSAGDADGDAMSYYLYDDNAAAGSGTVWNALIASNTMLAAGCGGHCAA